MTEQAKELSEVLQLRAELAEAIHAKRAAEDQLREVSNQLEFDRTAVADCLSAANRAIDSRHWLTEGRGPYEWDDDNWHKEFYAAAIEIRTAIAPLTKIAADWKDCPQSGAEVAQARVDLRAELRDAVDALRLIADNSESSYWELRHWLDSRPDCREWVHGDDGPAYPFMQLAQKARGFVAAYDAKHREGK